jgi:hypothetical protein
VLEDLEEQDVDRDVARVQIADDPLRRVVEFRGHEDDLVGLVERLLVQVVAEPLPERGVEVTALGEPLVDLSDLVCRELLDPRGVVEGLGDNLARRPVAFEFDQHQRGVGRDRQKVDPATHARLLLPADEHPLAREDLRRGHDHVLQLLLVQQGGRGQRRRLGTDLPKGMSDGHLWPLRGSALGARPPAQRDHPAYSGRPPLRSPINQNSPQTLARSM